QPTVVAKGQVVDGNGEAVAGANVGVIAQNRVCYDVVNQSDGAFMFTLPGNIRINKIYALKSGVGFDYEYRSNRIEREMVTLVLENAKTVSVRLIDTNGNPVPGRSVQPSDFHSSNESALGTGKWIPFSNTGDPLMARITDADGVATFDYFPKWQSASVTFSHHNLTDTRNDKYLRTYITYDPEKDDARIEATLTRAVPIRGTVRYADGRPVAGIPVKATMVTSLTSHLLNGKPFPQWAQGYTDENGRYELRGWPGSNAMVIANNDQWTAPPQTPVLVPPTGASETSVEGIDLTVLPTTRLYGKVTLQGSQQPQPINNVSVFATLQGGALSREKQLSGYPVDSPFLVYHSGVDQNGNYELKLGPGSYCLEVSYNNYYGNSDGDLITFIVSEGLILEAGHDVEKNIVSPYKTFTLEGRVELSPELEERSLEGIDITLTPATLTSQPVTVTTGADGRFAIANWTSRRVFGEARSKDGQLVAAFEIAQGEHHPVATLHKQVRVTGRLIDEETGDPLADTTIECWYYQDCGDDHPGATSATRFATTKTDESGCYAFDNLIPGREYKLHIESYYPEFVQMSKDMQSVSYARSFDVKIQPVTPPMDLGERKVSTIPSESELVYWAFQRKDALARIQAQIESAETDKQRLLVLVGEEGDSVSRDLLAAFFDRSEIQQAFSGYRFFGLPTDCRPSEAENNRSIQSDEKRYAQNRERLETVARETRFKIPERTALAMLLVFEPDGTLVTSCDVRTMTRENPNTRIAFAGKLKTTEINRELLLEFLRRYRSNRQSGDGHGAVEVEKTTP
ncbi:MAG: hypothetical protein FWH27_11490, partial [Planctomycetaceae bacterium]|nr:hypothetical protein [Planctomycetaceae bacterium]